MTQGQGLSAVFELVFSLSRCPGLVGLLLHRLGKLSIWDARYLRPHSLRTGAFEYDRTVSWTPGALPSGLPNTPLAHTFPRTHLWAEWGLFVVL